MIPRNWWNLQNIAQNEKDEKKRLEKQIDAQTLFNRDVYFILNKGFLLADNARGALLEVTFTALNTNTAFRHGLDFVPQNYIVVGLSADMRLYDGTESNDKTFINLRVAGTVGTARIFVF